MRLPTRMGIGLAALGRPGYLNLGHGEALGDDRSPAALERHAHAVLDAAYAGGIRYFDTARSYGRGEAFLAAWLESRAPADAVVGSKWGYVYTAAWQVDADPPEVKHHDVATFRRQLEETRELLGDRLALYQIHSATRESGVLEDDEVLAALGALRAEGVAIGLSVSGPSQGATIDRALERGGFDAVQATWNLHERAAGPALERAHAAGLAVIVKEGVANGRLTPASANAALEGVAAGAGVTSDALALAAVLARPWVDTVLSGAGDVAQLESNLHALELVWTPELEVALAGLEEDSETYWQRRSALPWT
jgi:aryl-alcohol dehydrogenase-like predicted oxidoreductase